MFALVALLSALAANAAMIHPGGNDQVCLEAREAANGAQVIVNNCNGSELQNWAISPGSTHVQLAGKNFCLDTGDSPGNGVQMKVWQCYDAFANQAWYLTGDGRIAVEGKGQCLDLPSGSIDPGNVIQTWECGTGNPNQFWTVGDGPGPTPGPSSSQPPVSCVPPVTVTLRARENRYQH